MSTLAKAVIQTKNILARLGGKPDTAVARWRDHFASAKSKVNMEDLQIIGEHTRLKEANEAGQARYEKERTQENYRAWHEARQAFLRCNGNFLIWSQHVGSTLPRIESLLDPALARDALREAEAFVGEARSAAAAAADEAAEIAGIPSGTMHEKINARFIEKERNLQWARTSIDNHGRTDRACFPKGLSAFNDYLTVALEP